jgi:HEAT repeat protein
MSFLKQIFAGKAEPSERQISRAIKQVTQQHGEAATRVAAMERLADWRTPEAAAALLRRFTVQVPQASMDLEEKQYAVRLLVQMGQSAVEPILDYLRTEPEVTWPVRALRELLPMEEYSSALLNILNQLASAYTRWPEAKKALLEHILDESFAQVRETVMQLLEDEDDDVCIAAADYLARNGDEDVREHLLRTFLGAEARPRVRGRILDHFCDREWPVKGYRKRVEEALQMPFYLTAKGTVKRRAL